MRWVVGILPYGSAAATIDLELRSSFVARLTRLARRPLEVSFTRNRRTYLSWRPQLLGPTRVRVHEVFVSADEATLVAIAGLITGENRAEARQQLRLFWEQQPTPRTPPRRKSTPRHEVGEIYHLGDLMAAINAEHFGGGVQATIGWGQAPATHRRQHIRLGSYDFEQRHITIHPLLDSAEVPRCVITHTIHHEMLHQVVGVKSVGGRRVVHPREFRERERRFPHYDDAIRWLEVNLPVLLGQRKKVRPPKSGNR